MAHVSSETPRAPQDPHMLAAQCKEAIKEVTFPNLATRQLFEALIRNIDAQ